MIQGLLTGLVLLSLSTQAEATRYVCVEQQGGWCESGGNCHVNNRPRATYYLTVIAGASVSRSSKSVLQECRNGICGRKWDFVTERFPMAHNLRSIAVTGGEILEIHTKSGQFTLASWQTGERLARVNATFGACAFSDPR